MTLTSTTLASCGPLRLMAGLSVAGVTDTFVDIEGDVSKDERVEGLERPFTSALHWAIRPDRLVSRTVKHCIRWTYLGGLDQPAQSCLDPLRIWVLGQYYKRSWRGGGKSRLSRREMQRAVLQLSRSKA
jgi:hypothetical protein